MNAERNSAAAPITALGPLLEHFPYDKTSILHTAFGLSIAMLLLAALLLKEWLQLSDSTVCFGSIALAAGFVFLIALRDRRNWPYGATLYEDGFANYDHTGLVQVRWDQIKTLEHWVGERELVEGLITEEDSISHRYIVRTQSNEVIALTDRLLGIDYLWAAIGANTAAAKVDDYLAVIESGQTLAFGPFLMDAYGLHYDPQQSDKSRPAVAANTDPATLNARDPLHRIRKSQKAKSIAWNEIEAVQLRPQQWQPGLNEIVIIERVPSVHPDQVWARHTEHEIANWHIMAALCRHMVEASAARSMKES